MAGKIHIPASAPTVRTIAVRLGIVLGLLIGVVLVMYAEKGLLDTRTGEAPDFWDCVYFATVTVTTVGYGDIVPVTRFSRLTDIFLLTPVRFFVIFIFLGTAYQLAVKRFQEEYRMKRAVERLDNHILICGFGATGAAAVRELLLQGTPTDQVVVLDVETAGLDEAAALGVVAVEGDATREHVLKSVAVERAAHVLVSPGRDDTAVLIALTVRDLNRDARIICMCHEEENVRLVQRSGADIVISPSSAGGNLMAAATRRTNLVETMQDMLSVGGSLQLDEREVRSDEIGLKPRNLPEIAVVRVYRADRHFNLPDLPSLEAGDRIAFVTSAKA